MNHVTPTLHHEANHVAVEPHCKQQRREDYFEKAKQGAFAFQCARNALTAAGSGRLRSCAIWPASPRRRAAERALLGPLAS